MTSSKIFDSDFSSDNWRARAAQLFAHSEAADTIIERELLRRRAVAAENIAESMDVSVRLSWRS